MKTCPMCQASMKTVHHPHEGYVIGYQCKTLDHLNLTHHMAVNYTYSKTFHLHHQDYGVGFDGTNYYFSSYGKNNKIGKIIAQIEPFQFQDAYAIWQKYFDKYNNLKAFL